MGRQVSEPARSGAQPCAPEAVGYRRKGAWGGTRSGAERSCTDPGWLLAFAVALGGLGGAAIYANGHGNIDRLRRLPNGDGLLCGMEGRGQFVFFCREPGGGSVEATWNDSDPDGSAATLARPLDGADNTSERLVGDRHLGTKADPEPRLRRLAPRPHLGAEFEVPGDFEAACAGTEGGAAERAEPGAVDQEVPSWSGEADKLSSYRFEVAMLVTSVRLSHRHTLWEVFGYVLEKLDYTSLHDTGPLAEVFSLDWAARFEKQEGQLQTLPTRFPAEASAELDGKTKRERAMFEDGAEDDEYETGGEADEIYGMVEQLIKFAEEDDDEDEPADLDADSEVFAQFRQAGRPSASFYRDEPRANANPSAGHLHPTVATRCALFWIVEDGIWFLKPPHVELLAAEGFAEVEVETFEGGAVPVFVSAAGVKGAFHRLTMPEWLSRYFGLPDALAEGVGVVGQVIDGAVAVAGDAIAPLARALPAWFTWGLFFCQWMRGSLCRRVHALFASEPLRDRGRSAVLVLGDALHEPRRYARVDNLGVVGDSRSEVEHALADMAQVFESFGLPARGEEVRGDAAEVILGHCASYGLVRRPVSSCFHSVCTFIGLAAVAAVREGRVAGFSRDDAFLFSDWWPRWNRLASARDASEWGLGVSTSLASDAEVEAAGRTRESDRFRCVRGDGCLVRELAGLPPLAGEGLPGEDFDGLETALASGENEVNLGFSEVASAWLAHGR
ncbi:unnamed protein product [Prorocentrum cordatum]|uniref:Uncharacterized protein n=1 Tax=Prorocentrum cordatum TaxID=2364126 RepID=A0ABN9USP8_9DINO|nr:unnamed protein product [Polarella glacialis]